MRVNLLRRLPFSDDYFDVVYSSHVLEHFPRETAAMLLSECQRVLKPRGILRTVVPDLENTCREYIRILDTFETLEQSRRRYEWIVLELLDQLTRVKPSGEMSPYTRKLVANNEQELMAYVRSRTDTTVFAPPYAGPELGRWRRITWNKVKTKLTYTYVAAVKRLLPPSLRTTLMDDTRIGEKHKWMYDQRGLRVLMESCGFHDVTFLTAATSEISGFNSDCLDVEPDGTVYKPASLFCEARKPQGAAGASSVAAATGK